MTAYSFLGFHHAHADAKPARFMAKQFVGPVALEITDHNFLWTEVVMPNQLVKTNRVGEC